MTGPLALDVDLRDPRPQIPAGDRMVQALLWWGDHLVGEASIARGRRSWELVRQDLIEMVSDAVAALESMPALRDPGTLSGEERARRGAVVADLTVVVCTRERPAHLVRCLEALSRLDPAPAEIIVVDNAPVTGSTAELARLHSVRHVVEPQPGLSHARNAGWSAARTPLIAFTDDDARPHCTWLTGLLRGFGAPQVDVVTGLVVAAELVTPAQRLFERNGGMRKGLLPRLFTADDVGVRGYHLGVGANMAFRRTALERIGGFDVRLGPGRPTRGADDLDAFVRVLATGGVAAYRPDAVVRHVHRRDIRGLVAQYQDNGTGFAALLHGYAVERGPLSAEAKAERRRWRWRRHCLDLLRAARRKRRGQFLEIAAEILGGRRGVAAWVAETERIGGARER